jgi:pimeloyl-ACP methyl ester carboxylesterase
VNRPVRTPLWSFPFWIIVDLLATVVAYVGCLWSRLFGHPGRVLPRRAGAEGRASPVLLVHGFTMNEGSLATLTRRLLALGCGPIALVRYAWLRHPELAVGRILAAARDLAKAAGVAKVDVVAHSLGGVLAHSARALPGSGGTPIGRVISLGTVHRGTWYARLPVGPMAEALAPRASADGRPGDLAITSDADLFIPWRRATLDPPAETVILDRVGHAGLLLDPRVASMAARHLLLVVPPA